MTTRDYSLPFRTHRTKKVFFFLPRLSFLLCGEGKEGEKKILRLCSCEIMGGRYDDVSSPLFLHPPTQDEFPSPLSPNRLHLPPPLPPSRFLGERRYVREICVVFLFGTTVTTADSDDDILTCSLSPSSTAKLLFLDCCANNFLCSSLQ